MCKPIESADKVGKVFFPHSVNFESNKRPVLKSSWLLPGNEILTLYDQALLTVESLRYPDKCGKEKLFRKAHSSFQPIQKVHSHPTLEEKFGRISRQSNVLMAFKDFQIMGRTGKLLWCALSNLRIKFKRVVRFAVMQKRVSLRTWFSFFSMDSNRPIDNNRQRCYSAMAFSRSETQG